MRHDTNLDAAFARYRHGRDPSALGEVFDIAAPEALRVATYLCADVATAEDVVQATFLSVIESAQRHDPRLPVMPWLLGILANHVREHRRRAARRPDATRLEATRRSDPSTVAAQREADAAIRDAIDHVAEPYREVLRMSLRDGLEPKEIAHSLDRPQGTVRSQLHRGLDLLRKALPVGLSLAGVTATRGLAALRAEVLRSAEGWGGGAGAAAAVGTVGAPILSKKLLLAGAVVALLLATSWVVHVVNRADADRSRNDGSTRVAERDGGSASVSTSVGDDPVGGDASGTNATADENAAVPVINLRVSVGEKRAAGVNAVARALEGVDSSIYYTTRTTDAHGLAKFPAQPRGQMIIQLLWGPTVVVNAAESSGVDITMGPGVTVTGRVLEPGGRPVPNARVLAYGVIAPDGLEVARTDDDGRYTVNHVGESMLFSACAAGWSPAPLVSMGGKGGDTAQLDLVLPGRGGSVRALVRDADGNPVRGAVVFVGDRRRLENDAVPHARAETGADGTIAVQGIAAGEHPVTVRARGFAPWRGEVMVRVDDTPVHTFDLQRAATVRGRVLDSEGKPLAHQRVALQSAAAELARPRTWSAEDGTFSLGELPAGELALTAGNEQGLHATRSFLLAQGETVEWDARIPKGAVLSGIVLADDRSPKNGWAVELWGRGLLRAWHHQTTTDDQGRFRVEVPDASAEYLVQAKANWPDPAWRARADNVKPGGETIELIATEAERPRCWVQGVLQTATGNPLGGLAVFVWEMEGTGPAARTSHASGAFKVGPLKPGRYRAFVRDMAGKQPVLLLGEHDLGESPVLDLGTVRMPVPGAVRIRIAVPEGAKHGSGGISGFLGMLAVEGPHTTEADGARYFPLMAPGNIEVEGYCMLDGKQLSKKIEVEIRSGETTEVTIRLP